MNASHSSASAHIVLRAAPQRRSWWAFVVVIIFALLSLCGCGDGQKREPGDCLLSKDQAPQVAQAWEDSRAAEALASAPDATPEQTAAALALWRAATSRLLAGLANAALPPAQVPAAALSAPTLAGAQAREKEAQDASAAQPAPPPGPAWWTLGGIGALALTGLALARANKLKIGAVLSMLPPPAGTIATAVLGFVGDATWNATASAAAHKAETAAAGFQAQAQALLAAAGPALDAIRADPTLANRIPAEVWYLVNLISSQKKA